MAFKPGWYPIAVLLTLFNLGGVGFAAGQGEPTHAAVHALLAVAFGLWAQRLRRRPSGGEVPAGSELQARLEALEGLETEVTHLRQELTETQERLDFAERLLAQERDARRVGPQR